MIAPATTIVALLATSMSAITMIVAHAPIVVTLSLPATTVSPVAIVAITTAITAIARTAIPHAADAHADPRRVAATITIAAAVIAAVDRRCVVAIVVGTHTVAVISVSLIAGLAHIAVARVDIATGQRNHCGGQDETGKQAFHAPSPLRMTAPR